MRGQSVLLCVTSGQVFQPEMRVEMQIQQGSIHIEEHSVERGPVHHKQKQPEEFASGCLSFRRVTSRDFTNQTARSVGGLLYRIGLATRTAAAQATYEGGFGRAHHEHLTRLTSVTAQG